VTWSISGVIVVIRFDSTGMMALPMRDFQIGQNVVEALKLAAEGAVAVFEFLEGGRLHNWLRSRSSLATSAPDRDW